MMDGCPPAPAPTTQFAQLPTRLPSPAFAATLQAVIFDMDGLMLDTERWERTAWRLVAREQGRTFSDEFFATLVGRRESDTLPRLREHFGEHFPLEAARVRVRALFESWVEHCPTPVKPGVASLLAALRRLQIPLAVASSTARAPALQRLGDLATYFRASVFGDEVAHAKPHPEIYDRALAQLGVAPKDALALEDSPPGLRAARAAGLTTVVIPDLLPPPEDAVYACNSLSEVEKWLQSGRARTPRGKRL
jgi:HAD superfamily hydrolase (TIGR01509 family)